MIIIIDSYTDTLQICVSTIVILAYNIFIKFRADLYAISHIMIYIDGWIDR